MAKTPPHTAGQAEAHRTRHRPQRWQTGLTLVELLVGMALGLVVAGGALALFLTELQTSRRLLLEARLGHDLRAAADLLARDLRRAGHWEASTTSDANTNPHGAIELDDASLDGLFRRVRYSFDLPGSDPLSAAFAQTDHKLTLALGGSGQQELTDPAVVRITQLAITPTDTHVSLAALCPQACGSPDTPNTCPTLAIRRYDIVLRAQATTDPSLQREVRTTVHVRNDQWSGTCPGT
ncbi:PilW family protein [Hydrogenophaga defluvii]|uniref:PilW family protein n=1 Tax=Hydrogenophaga defluvii TaxID=249410 RepID=A0ABW2SDF7_9BURK